MITSQSPGVPEVELVARKRVLEEIKEDPVSRIVHILFMRRSYIPRRPSSQRIQPVICQPSPGEEGVSLDGLGWAAGVVEEEERKRLQEEVEEGVEVVEEEGEDEEEREASGCGPITNSATRLCTKPEGC